jgi:hypothetical protein
VSATCLGIIYSNAAAAVSQYSSRAIHLIRPVGNSRQRTRVPRAHSPTGEADDGRLAGLTRGRQPARRRSPLPAVETALVQVGPALADEQSGGLHPPSCRAHEDRNNNNNNNNNNDDDDDGDFPSHTGWRF